MRSCAGVRCVSTKLSGDFVFTKCEKILKKQWSRKKRYLMK